MSVKHYPSDGLTLMNGPRGPIIWRVIWLSVTTVAELLALAVVAWAVLPRAFNVNPFVVLTGSMQPALPVGSVVFTRPTQPQSIVPGDILTFRQPGATNILITHRVIHVIQNPDGLAYQTKGDANNVVDAQIVSESDVVGTRVFVIPLLGYALDAFGRGAFLLFIALFGTIIIVGQMHIILGHSTLTLRKKLLP